MKKYLWILLLFAPFLGFSQAQNLFNGRLTVFNVTTGGTSDFVVQSLFNDSRANFNGSEVAIGDYVFLRVGTNCSYYRIEAINNAGALIDVDVSDTALAGLPDSGEGAIMRFTPNVSLPLDIPNISETLDDCIEAHTLIIIDQLLSSITATTTYIDKNIAFTGNTYTVTANGGILPTDTKKIRVHVDGHRLSETDDYSISGSNILFTWTLPGQAVFIEFEQ